MFSSPHALKNRILRQGDLCHFFSRKLVHQNTMLPLYGSILVVYPPMQKDFKRKDLKKHLSPTFASNHPVPPLRTFQVHISLRLKCKGHWFPLKYIRPDVKARSHGESHLVLLRQRCNGETPGAFCIFIPYVPLLLHRTTPWRLIGSMTHSSLWIVPIVLNH